MDSVLLVILLVGGVIALGLVMLFVIRKNDESDIPMSRTDAATDRLYEEVHEEEERKYHKDEDKPA